MNKKDFVTKKQVVDFMKILVVSSVVAPFFGMLLLAMGIVLIQLMGFVVTLPVGNDGLWLYIFVWEFIGLFFSVAAVFGDDEK